MQKIIVILTSGHPPFDERIYNKFASTFSKNNYKTVIISSIAEIRKEENNIEILGFYDNKLTKRKKIFKFIYLLEKYSPDIIICCEPLTIMAAALYRKKTSRQVKIFTDITEWYPENVALKYSGLKRYLIYIALYLFNILTSNLADKMIIGETGKQKRYNLIAPSKEKIIIGYYPPLKYFPLIFSIIHEQDFIICFSGIISKQRGIYNVLNAVKLLIERNPDSKISLKIIGKFNSSDEERLFNEKFLELNIKTEMIPWTDYKDFSYQLADVDVCLDLREKNFIYNNSLPIKIFDYLASGKPFVYSDIRPLLNESFIKDTGFLVNPENPVDVVEKLEAYLKDRNLLLTHSQNARNLFEEKYNWDSFEQNLIGFIESD